jgi:hypothetical protein
VITLRGLLGIKSKYKRVKKLMIEIINKNARFGV